MRLFVRGSSLEAFLRTCPRRERTLRPQWQQLPLQAMTQKPWQRLLRRPPSWMRHPAKIDKHFEVGYSPIGTTNGFNFGICLALQKAQVL